MGSGLVFGGPRGTGGWRRGDERGFALAFALVFTFMLTLLAITFQGLGGTEADLVQRQTTHTQALYLAEAGLERALYYLRLDPAWRGVDPPNGVAFGEGDRSLGYGSYRVLLYDANNDGRGLYDPTIPGGQVVLQSTGTAGPVGASSRRRVESRVEIENGFNIPSFIYFPGVLDQVKLRGSFLIDGHDTDPLSGKREEDGRCETLHGIASGGDIGEILEELRDQHTEAQVIGLGSPPSVALAEQRIDIAQLADQILGLSQGQSFYHPFKDKQIEDDTAWGSYPNDLRVVRVEGTLEVKNNKTLSGAGILIVEDELKIDNKSTFNWKGLVIVTNRDGKDDADVEFDYKGGGTLYGALLIGGGNNESELELKPDPNFGNEAKFFYSCDVLDTIVNAFPSFVPFRKVTSKSWREVNP